MPPSDFAKADLSKILEELTTDEAVSLIAGVGFWHTYAIKRLGIPAVKVSDGPNGIRGNHFLMSTPAKVLLCSTAMGATFDPELIRDIGLKLLAQEAKLKAASLALAPTCNIQRNPLGGRSFESFSEDPYLSGILASAYINGLQEGGIGATIKHFCANDKEDERFSYDSIVSDRALREIYMMPFMLAQKYAKPWAIMTAYNRLDGTHVAESPNMLQGIVRKEWGFDGMFTSDWYGTYGVDAGINAGVDLEMPGVNKWRTLDLTQRCISARKVTVRTIKERALQVLKVVQKCAQKAPEVLDGDGEERTQENEEDAALLRKVAAESIVLLKNDNGVLPIDKTKIKKVAIVGGNAKAVVLSGGGSAALKPSYFVSPYDGIVNALGKGIAVTYGEGARAFLTLPTLEWDLTTEKDKGERGWTAEWYSHESDDSMQPLDTPVATQFLDETRLFISTSSYPEGITRKWTMKLRGFLKPKPYDIDFEFGLIAAGRAKLLVDGNSVIDNWTRQRRGNYFFGFGSVEERGVYHLQANRSHEIYVEFCNVRAPADGDEDETVLGGSGVRLGGAEVRDSDDLMNQAVELAREADVVIAVVGLNADFETEGYDRKTLALPGRTDELIQKVAEANKNTIVVTQAGSAITMPWVDAVPSIVHAWYLGNTTGDAIAQVLIGDVNPAGRLSLTFPKRLEDVPSYASFSLENGKVRYSEDLMVGYKHYHKTGIKPLFDFGHGLSYTTFRYSNLRLSDPAYTDGDVHITATLRLTNTGSVTGSEAVQLYVTLPAAAEYTHPPLQLKGFKKVRNLKAGASEEVMLKLDKYAVSYWDERYSTWNVDKGTYTVRVGGTSAKESLVLSAQFEVPKSFTWNGL